MPESDDGFRDLLHRALDGSEEAARELVARYGASLRRAVRRCLSRRLRSLFDSADFEQIVWLSVFRHREDLARIDRPEDLAKFLVGVAKRKVAAEERRRLVRVQHNLNRERSLEASIEDAADVPERRAAMVESLACRERLGKFLSELPEPKRQIVELRLKGLNKGEIARRLDIPERTLRRSWKKLFLFWKKVFSKNDE